MVMMLISQAESLIASALSEDLSSGDVTSDALIPADIEGKAFIISKSEGVLAGTEVAAMVFCKVEPSLEVETLIPDGARIRPGDKVMRIIGKVREILKAERTALNFLQRLSGIATETARYVEAVSGLNVKIADTRKTTPSLRVLEKYAVRVGRGYNHRQNLGDGILIKDNHLSVLRTLGLGMREIIGKAKQDSPLKKVEVEVETVEQALEAINAGADIVMLDNMRLEDMCRVVELNRGTALIEASGGITLGNVRAVAEVGADFISVGALTHSVKALDLSLELNQARHPFSD